MMSFEERQTLRRLVADARWRQIRREDEEARKSLHAAAKNERQSREEQRRARELEREERRKKTCVCSDCGRGMNPGSYRRARREGRPPRCKSCGLKARWAARRQAA
jgi:hypothetical protein